MQFGFNTPFFEQLEFFRQKLNLPTERWDDIQRSAHDRAFIVAGAMKAELLDDLQQSLFSRMADGRGYEQFHKDFRAIVAKHGWTGWTGEGSKAGEAWRTKVIYQANMVTSYAAGRYRQLTDPDYLALRPYWRYRHADGVMNPRLQHVAWNNLTLPHDHAFWKTHFSPNGWGCLCRVIAVDAREYAKAQAAGLAEPPAGWDERDAQGNLPGIAKGFDYAPGASVRRPLKDFIDEKLVKLDAPIGAAMYEAMRPVLVAERQAAWREWLDAVLSDPIKRNRLQVVGAIDRDTLAWLQANKAISPASAEIAIRDGLVIGKKAERHAAAGDALSDREWLSLPEILDDPAGILFDRRSGKLLYLADAADSRTLKLALEFDFHIKKGHQSTNLLVSAFKTHAADLEGMIKGGIYEVVK